MTSNAERQRQWKMRNRVLFPPRPVGRPPSHPHEKVSPDPHFCLAASVVGYKPSKRTEIRPAFCKLESSGPVLVLVRDGKPVVRS